MQIDEQVTFHLVPEDQAVLLDTRAFGIKGCGLQRIMEIARCGASCAIESSELNWLLAGLLIPGAS